MVRVSPGLGIRLAAGVLMVLFSGCFGTDDSKGWRQGPADEADADFHPHHRGRDAAPLPDAAAAPDAGRDAVSAVDAAVDAVAAPDADDNSGSAVDAAVDTVAAPDAEDNPGSTVDAAVDAVAAPDAEDNPGSTVDAADEVGSSADAIGEAASPDAAGADLGGEASAPVTVIVLPDTQYYSSLHPDIYAVQTGWIVEQQSARNIALALHVGDLVDTPNSHPQWAVANSSMRVLDGLVPYVIVSGNHDMDANRAGLMNNTFPPSTMPWITGTMTEGQIDNNYTVVDIGPQKWLVLGLEFGPRDAVLTWADAVLKAYPTLPAIIVTHAYLYGDVRYDYAAYGSTQNYYPRFYEFTPSEGINDGEDIWQKLIVPNPNVRLVFCGHLTGAGRLTSLRADGSRVHQMLSDYQWLYAGTADDLGGSGYLRILQFDYGKKEIRVQTYSPYLGKSMTDDANQFTISLEI